MYKMFIVDDNQRDRRGIQTVLNWDEIGICIAGSYSNGKAALEQFNKIKPDVVLTDISMPVMNGIEMARKMKDINPDIKIIFMSCYNEFDFARSAVELGIEDYVLKPIIQEELEKAIRKTTHKYQTEQNMKTEKEEMLKQINQSLPLFRDQFLRELFFGYYTNIDEIESRSRFLGIRFHEKQTYCVVTFILNENVQKFSNIKTDERYFIGYSIQKSINEYNLKPWPFYSYQVSETEFSVVFMIEYHEGSRKDDDLFDAIIAMKEEIEEKLDISLVIGISKRSGEILDIPVLFQQSLKAIQIRLFSDKNDIILYKDIEVLENSKFEEQIDLHQLCRDIRQVIEYGEEDEIPELINKYIRKELTVYSEGYVKNIAFSIVNTLQIMLIESDQSFQNIFGNDISVWEKLRNFESIKDIHQWLYNLIKAVIEHMCGKRMSQYEKIVKDVKGIIEKRYNESITVNEIAESIYLSPYHTNSIFKQVTGKTIFDYLTEYRMEKAKELLKNPYSRIYLVADSVGYKNKSHFCLTFKKYAGITPSEYKSRALPGMKVEDGYEE